MTSIRVRLLSATAAAALSVGMAQAQPTPAPASPSGALEEIIVTANKTSSNAQKTPIAMAVVSGAALSREGVTDIGDLAKVAPSIQFQPIRQKAITFIRGVGQGISSGNVDPAVAINLNGAYLPAEMTNTAFFDVERVEVLYGPQGTIYGRNAVGGAINVITKRPGKVWAGDATAEVGNYANRLIMGGVDAPLSQNFRIRLAGIHSQHNGYFTNGLSDLDVSSVRLSALYEPTDRTSAYLVVGYSRERDLGGGAQNFPPLTSNPWYLPFDARAVPLYNHDDDLTTSLELDHDFGSGVKFASISSYGQLHQKTNFLSFIGNIPNDIFFTNFAVTTHYGSQELRLSGTSGRLNWIAGLYGYDNRYNELGVVRYQKVPTPQLRNGFNQDTRGAAAFGQLTYSLDPSVRVLAGARYSYDKRRIDGLFGAFFNVGQPAPPPAFPYNGRRSDSRPDFKVGLEYDAAPRSLLYANFQTGYAGGGFSAAEAVAGAPAAATFLPMTVKAWALGSKNRFIDNRLQFNFELFYDIYKNYQVSARSLTNPFVTIFNAKRTEIYGVQFDTRFQLTRLDDLGASAGLLHAVFNKLIVPLPPYNLSGYRPPMAPALTLNVDYTHHFPLANGATVDLYGNYRHVSSQYGVYNHLPGTFIRAYGMGDALLTYVAPEKRWTAGLYVRNISNVFIPGFIIGGATPGPASGFPLAPRTFGARLTANF